MRLTRVMHEQEDLLNSKGQVCLRQCEVLKGAGEAPVLGGVSHRGTVSGGQLGPCIVQCGSGVALGHASLLEEGDNVLVLGQEKTGVILCHSNPEEVM